MENKFVLLNTLLEHKEKQQKLFKTYKINWNEKEYIFLNQYRKPFIPENLSGNMKKFIEKYKVCVSIVNKRKRYCERKH